MRYSEAKKRAVSILEKAGIEEAGVDAEYLLLFVTGKSKADLLMKLFDEMPVTEEKAYEELLARRSTHEPLQYIIGNQNFMGYTFMVSPDVLIPRFDTEILAEHAGKRALEAALKMIKGSGECITGVNSTAFRILDICTGSGCVPVSVGLNLYKELKEHRLKCYISVTAADISEAAVALAEKNYRLNVTEGNENGALPEGLEYHFVISDLFNSIDGKYYIITANPPYIVRNEIDELMPEISEHEPRLALDGGVDGMDFYRRIVREAAGYLYPGGRLLMEFDDSQAEPVREMMESAGFTEVEVHRDLAGLQRVIEGKWQSQNRPRD